MSKKKTKKVKSSPQVSFSVGDYIIANISDAPNAKPVIGMVEKKSSNKCRAAIDGNSENTFDFLPENVMGNLGAVPKPGSIYGVTFEPLVKEIQTPFGEGATYARFKKKHLVEFHEALRNCHKKLKKKGLLGFLPVEVHIKQPKGSMGGYYKHFSKPTKRDIMAFMLNPSFDFPHIIFHEYGHGVWHHLLTDKERKSWVKAYHSCVKIRTLEKSDLKNFLSGIQAEMNLTVTEYMKQLDKEEKELFKQVLQYINKVHALNKHDLDIIRSNNDSIKEYFPASPLEVSEVVSFVSDYARKNSTEHFCECFANFMTGHELPKKLQKLMKKTLEKCKGRTVDVGEE